MNGRKVLVNTVMTISLIFSLVGCVNPSELEVKIDNIIHSNNQTSSLNKSNSKKLLLKEKSKIIDEINKSNIYVVNEKSYFSLKYKVLNIANKLNKEEKNSLLKKFYDKSYMSLINLSKKGIYKFPKNVEEDVFAGLLMYEPFKVSEKWDRFKKLKKIASKTKINIIQKNLHEKFICSFNSRGYIPITQIDNFGNKNEKFVSVIEYRVRKYIQNQDLENLEKFFAENIYLNMKDATLPFKEISTYRKGIYLNSILRINLRFLISRGLLPSNVELNTLNVSTVKNKLRVNVDIYTLAATMANYLLSSNESTLRDRLLLMAAFLLYKKEMTIPYHCYDNWFSDFATDYIKGIIVDFVKLLQRKDPLALRVAVLLVDNKYNEIDKLLLSQNEIKHLFLIGKKHYIEFQNMHSKLECKAERFIPIKIKFVCFDNKRKAALMYNKLLNYGSLASEFLKNGNLDGEIFDNVQGYLSRYYCSYKKGELLPKIFENMKKTKYCIVSFEGVRNR